MTSASISGTIAVALAGLVLGSGAWPVKLMRSYQFEHWWFVGMLTGLIIIPWTVTLLGCPHALAAYATVPWRALITANLWGLGWGVANILCGLCFVRIGMALTCVLLTGLGASIGVSLPMIVKGSGLFQEAPGLGSPAGRTLLAGAAVMLIGVIIAGLAGHGRDCALPSDGGRAIKFRTSLLMAVVAGVLSAGFSLSFVYGQGPITDAMKRAGAGEIPATFAVWAGALLAGSLLSVIYAAWLMTRRNSWRVLGANRREFLLAAVIGLNMSAGVGLLGQGMILLGTLGASVGFGIQQATWMLGGQGVGFVSGEWRGVRGVPRRRIYAAITLLLVAVLIMAYGNTLVKG